MNELWVARDESRPENGSVVVVSDKKPIEIDGGTGMWLHPRKADWMHVSAKTFPDLKPGQCRRPVLAEETSE